MVLFSLISFISQSQKLQRPKVVIGLVVDQMRWDYLYKYYDRYTDNGFKRLMRDGYNFQNTLIPYAPSVTSAGHATIYTGTVSAIHGIVGNDWIDRETNTRKYSCTDNFVNSIGTNSSEGKMSPVNLLTTTIGDELRLSNNFKSRVFGIALKNRGAILSAGRSANAAYWLNDSSGNWITSSWYMQHLPEWLQQFNNKKLSDSLLSNNWNTLYPLNTYVNSTPNGPGFKKRSWDKEASSFPHEFKKKKGSNYGDLRFSPFGNTLTLELAKQLLISEKVGDSVTDMLCVSLSSTDYVTHEYGVNSVETEDTYLQLDKELAAFFSFLDKRYGNDYVLFLTADHGGLYPPAYLKEHSISTGSLYTWKLPDELNVLLKNFSTAPLISAVMENQVYFNHRIIDSLQLDMNAIKKTVTDYLLLKKEILTVLDYAHPEKWMIPEIIKNYFMNGFYAARSGDLQVILKSEYSDNREFGTEHGSIFKYDTHIPLIFFGWNIPKGNAYREVYMTDIAPTISSLLHIQMPGGTTGKSLIEILPQR